MNLPPVLDPRSYSIENIWAALYLLSGGIATAFALFVIIKQPGNRLVRALGLNLGTVILLMLTTGLMWTARDSLVAEQIIRPALGMLSFTGPLQCLFTMRLSGFEVRSGWRRVRDLGFGLASAFAILVVGTDLFAPGVIRLRYGFALAPGPMYVPYMCFYGVFWCISLVPLWVTMRTAKTSLGRRRAAYILSAYFVGGLSGVDGLLVYFPNMPPISWAAGLFATAILTYAIVQHRIMDLSTAIHRTFTRLVLSLLLFLPLYLVMWFLRGTLAESGPAAVALLVLALFVLLRAWFAGVQPWLDRLLARRRLRLERAIVAFAARAAELSGQSALAADVADTIKRLLSAETRAIVLRDEHGWRPVWPRESRLPQPEDSLVEKLALRPEVIALSELGAAEKFEMLERSVQRLCDRYGAAALLPLVHRGELAGVIAVGNPKGDRPLSHDEIEFLERLRNAATVAFVNAQLYESIERHAATLEDEVRARTAEVTRKVEDLKQAQAELVQTEKMASLGMLVAGVSHEINNALTFVYGNLPTLRKYLGAYTTILDGWREAARGASAQAELDAQVAEARYDFIRADTEPLIAAMEEGARRARTIVGDLRSFARHDESLVGVADVREGIESTLNLLRGGFATRISFTRDYAADLPRIECHPAQLNQVFLNLLLNAVESIDGTGQVQIRAECGPSGGVIVTITDSGRGIPEDVRARVWEPFFTTKRRREGAGLGLTICRTIVERHGGRIELHRGEPRGTRVRVELPRRAADLVRGAAS